MMNEPEKRERRIMLSVVVLVLLAAAIYAITFIKLPVWLPALK